MRLCPLHLQWQLAWCSVVSLPPPLVPVSAPPVPVLLPGSRPAPLPLAPVPGVRPGLGVGAVLAPVHGEAGCGLAAGHRTSRRHAESQLLSTRLTTFLCFMHNCALHSAHQTVQTHTPKKRMDFKIYFCQWISSMYAFTYTLKYCSY